MIRITGLLLFLAAMLNPAGVYAQLTDTSGFETGLRGAPLIYHPDARATAMGTASVADPGRLSALHMNPALLAFVRRPSTVQMDMNQSWDNNIQSHQLLLPALRTGEHNLALQFGFHRPGVRETSPAGAFPNPVPDLEMAQVHMAYAVTLHPSVSVGMLHTVAYTYNPNARFWTYHAGVGVLYSPSESVRYGIVYRGLGRSVTYEMIEDGRTTLGSQGVRDALELGATFTFPVDSDRTYLALSLSNEKQFGESGTWYKGGLEYRAISQLFLRSGLMFNPDQNVYSPRFGIGIEIGRLQVDYSLSHKARPLDRFHQFGIIFQL